MPKGIYTRTTKHRFWDAKKAAATKAAKWIMLGQEYRELRRILGVSQRVLAGKLDVNIETICNRETGKAPVNQEAVLAMKYLVGLRMKELEAVNGKG